MRATGMWAVVGLVTLTTVVIGFPNDGADASVAAKVEATQPLSESRQSSSSSSSSAGSSDSESDVADARQSSSSSSSSTSSSDSASSGWFGSTVLSDAMAVLFPGVRSEPQTCTASRDGFMEEGTCMRVTDCMYQGGTNMARCGGGIGACCSFSKKCTQSTQEYISHFVDEGYTSLDRGKGECKMTVNPMNSNVCQYRLDFEEFDIIGPNEKSICADDFMGVTGGGSGVPKLCGNLKGQHIYIDVKPGGGPIFITVDCSSVKTYARKWKIKVTQIQCNSPERAPNGCLQFFNETSGTVRSFNYKRINLPTPEDSRKIQNLKYGVCVNTKVGYCYLTWSKSSSNDYTFALSGDTTVSTDQLTTRTGTQDCRSDYITIPGGVVEDKATKTVIPTERFCGSNFPEVKTFAQPYVMHVVTDDDEEGNSGNLGFELNFRQNLCHS